MTGKPNYDNMLHRFVRRGLLALVLIGLLAATWAGSARASTLDPARTPRPICEDGAYQLTGTPVTVPAGEAVLAAIEPRLTREHHAPLGHRCPR